MEPAHIPQGPRDDKLERIWEPDPFEDFAPEPGTLEYCDGYSREAWQQLAAKNGLQRSKKGFLTRQWEDDPVRQEYAQRQ